LHWQVGLELDGAVASSSGAEQNEAGAWGALGVNDGVFGRFDLVGVQPHLKFLYVCILAGFGG